MHTPTASQRLKAKPAQSLWDGILKPFAHDKQLLFVTLGLSLFGLVILFSASAHYGAELNNSKLYYVIRQGLFMLAGLIAMWMTALFHEKRMKKVVWPLAWITLGLLILTAFVGDTANGSERWLSIGPIRFQTSELAKPAVALLLASSFGNTTRARGEHILKALLMSGLLIGIIFKQPNLSITLLLGSTLLATSFMGGTPLALYVLTIPPALLGVWIKIKNTPYQWRRIEGWLDPWQDQQDVGYNIIQSYYAIAGGNLGGLGYGNSIQKLFYLPFQHTDFIFAIICEELGILGAGITVLLYGWLTFRGFAIARKASSPFKQLFAFSLTWLIVAQAVINISVATGLFPVTGVTLPLISYGGTSVIVTMAMIGVLFALARPEKRAIHE